MKKLVISVIYIFCFTVAGFADDISLTIYNQNLGLVKDKREIKLDKGVQKVEFDDVAAQIDPTSVHFKSLTAPDKCSVLEQNFEYDLVSREKLLQKYIGKEIEIEKRLGTGGEKKEIIKGTLLSIAGGITLQTDNKILVDPSGEISLSKLPEGLILKPTLSWILENELPGKHNIEVDYLTNGINWDADYVIVSDKDDKNLDLTGWVTIDNKSGAAYKDAKLKLIAGDINRVSPPGMAREDVMYNTRMKKAAAPQFEEKSFFEYHMYTLQRPATVRDNETKQIEFVSAANVPVKKLFIYNGAAQQFYGYNEYSRSDRNYGTQTNKKVYVMLEFKNSKENNLGIPLPKGKMRVYKEDSDKSLEFIGEDNIDHTPKDEQIRIYLGDAFDIVGERVQTDFKVDTDAKWIDETIKINLRNHKEEPVEVKVVEKLYRWSNWKITQKSQDYKKKDSNTIEFNVEIPKDSETVVTYKVHYWWE